MMPGETDPDAALMMKVKEGDMTAFAELADKYKQPVINLAYRMLRDLAEAEDRLANEQAKVARLNELIEQRSARDVAAGT